MYTLIDLLETARAHYGPAPFLGLRREQETAWWSYQETADFSCRVANWLVASGIRPGDRVALWAPSQPRWVGAFFGILRAGAVVVPLDVNSTAGFVREVLERVGAKALLAGGAQAAKLPGLDVEVIPLDALGCILAPFPAVPPDHDVGPDDLAELVFTSGTTGHPKGVMLTHRNIIANLLASSQVMRCYPHYCVLSLLPLSHMFEQMGGLYMPMLGGSAVVYLSSLNPREVFLALRQERITCMLAVPQVLQLFMRRIEQEVQRRGQQRVWRLLNLVAPLLPQWARRLAFSSVHRSLGGRFQFFISGGAFLDPSLHRGWERLGIRVIQGYGATEAAPVITTNSLERRKLSSVGTPIDCLELRIAADGEVQVRGENVFQGYWQDPQRTQESFADGWYLTGDLGSLDKDGYVYLHGRKKDMIVLANGLNVYPEDVENALKASATVKDCVVVPLTGDAGPEVHAVLLMEDPAAAKEAVRAANRMLASHQHIRGHTVWPEPDFPRTHTLKVKRSDVQAHLVEMSHV